MFRSFLILSVGIFSPFISSAQASLATIGTAYTQDFNSLTGGTDGTAYTWTNNTTLTGWYIDETTGDDQPVLEASYTTMNNSGGSYMYRVSGNNSLGSRAAGSSGTIHYGVRLRNNTGTTVSSLYISYYGEQFTIAENGANVNTNTFSYQTGATVTSLTAGTWTNFTALDFTQIYTSTQSAGMGGTACAGTSAQCLALNGTLSANRVQKVACLDVTMAANTEIMLRWSDIDNAANDHHLQIDDISITPYDVNCTTLLPVEWLNFEANEKNGTVNLNWATASEENNDRFEIERAGTDAVFTRVGIIEGRGNSSQTNRYSFSDVNLPHGTWYYRIKQIDFNGNYDYSEIRAVTITDSRVVSFNLINTEDGISYTISGNSGKADIEIYSISGQLIASHQVSESNSGQLHLPAEHGLYIIRLISPNGIVTKHVAN
jgi:hypothetical protein